MEYKFIALMVLKEQKDIVSSLRSKSEYEEVENYINCCGYDPEIEFNNLNKELIETYLDENIQNILKRSSAMTFDEIVNIDKKEGLTRKKYHEDPRTNTLIVNYIIKAIWWNI